VPPAPLSPNGELGASSRVAFVPLRPAGGLNLRAAGAAIVGGGGGGGAVNNGDEMDGTFRRAAPPVPRGLNLTTTRRAWQAPPPGAAQ
jgi:hypothetical protein